MSGKQPDIQPLYPSEETIKSAMSEKFMTDSSLGLDFARHLALHTTVAGGSSAGAGRERTLRLVSSPQVALLAALRLLQMKPGESILCPVYWQRDYLECLLAMQLQPVLLEVTPHNMALDPMLLANYLERRAASGDELPRVVVVAHAHGIPANMELFVEVAQRYHLTIIEDCSDALGASIGGRPCGTWGQIAFYSFSMGSAIQCGTAGAISWADNRTLSPTDPYVAWSAVSKLELDEWLLPYSMPPLAAAVGIPQWEAFDEAQSRRRQLAKVYRKYTAQILGIRYLGWKEDDYLPGSTIHPIFVEPSMVRFSVRELQSTLSEAGFRATTPRLVHLVDIPLYRHLPSVVSGVAGNMARDILYLPSDPTLTGIEALEVGETMRRLVFKYNS